MRSLLLFGLIPSFISAQTVIFDMDTPVHRMGEITNKDKHKVPAGTVESVEGKMGKAVKFAFLDNARSGFATATVKTSLQWDQSAGFSFWVKGDGSASWGGIELIDKSDYKLRYVYCFPIDSTDWKQIVVPWRDLVPELAAPPVDPANGYKPSGFGNFWFGKWFYWRDYPAHSFTIDQVVLEKTIDLPPAPKVEPGLTRFIAKLKEKKPVTIVTMGDSLSDKAHWANRQVLWSTLLATSVKEKHGGDLKIINPAIGGTTLSQNIILIPRWAREAPSPDLVTILFGGNDWDSNVRGERFAQYLRMAVERIRRETSGSADILILSSCPAHARWETYKELEQAAATVAKETETAYADLAAAFRAAGQTPEQALKQTLWAWDKVHLGPKGHELVRDVVMAALEGR